jgi:hypothetical protein
MQKNSPGHLAPNLHAVPVSLTGSASGWQARRRFQLPGNNPPSRLIFRIAENPAFAAQLAQVHERQRNLRPGLGRYYLRQIIAALDLSDYLLHEKIPIVIVVNRP